VYRARKHLNGLPCRVKGFLMPQLEREKKKEWGEVLLRRAIVQNGKGASTEGGREPIPSSSNAGGAAGFGDIR